MINPQITQISLDFTETPGDTQNSKLETRNSKLYSLPRGAVAQLAERRVRNAEARSSTLLCSTKQIKHLQSPVLGGWVVL